MSVEICLHTFVISVVVNSASLVKLTALIVGIVVEKTSRRKRIKMITKKRLHEVEMDLVNLCEDNDVMKEIIINKFTNLMSEV